MLVVVIAGYIVRFCCCRLLARRILYSLKKTEEQDG